MYVQQIDTFNCIFCLFTYLLTLSDSINIDWSDVEYDDEDINDLVLRLDDIDKE
jgi:hypothetical protein